MRRPEFLSHREKKLKQTKWKEKKNVLLHCIENSICLRNVQKLLSLIVLRGMPTLRRSALASHTLNGKSFESLHSIIEHTISMASGSATSTTEVIAHHHYISSWLASLLLLLLAIRPFVVRCARRHCYCYALVVWSQFCQCVNLSSSDTLLCSLVIHTERGCHWPASLAKQTSE